jgi:hypothetical protein
MSTIVTDTITGKSTATTITIGSTPVVSASANSMTIRGEGSAQTSIQQGLAKMWVGWQYSSGSISMADSFNVSGTTDTGTGDASFSFSNTLSSNTGASGVVGHNHATTGNSIIDKDSTSAFANRLFNNSGSAEDAGGTMSMTIHGDLA